MGGFEIGNTLRFAKLASSILHYVDLSIDVGNRKSEALETRQEAIASKVSSVKMDTNTVAVAGSTAISVAYPSQCSFQSSCLTCSVNR